MNTCYVKYNGYFARKNLNRNSTLHGCAMKCVFINCCKIRTKLKIECKNFIICNLNMFFDEN